MLNLNQLETFVAIVDSGGFREAAHRLGCSQPTVSQQLRKLEESLGASLVVRDRTFSALTPHGANLLPFARNLLSAASRVFDIVGGSKLVVGASSNIGIYLLQPYIAQFKQKYDKRSAIDLKIASNPEIANRLSNGEFDMAVMEWWDHRERFMAKRWRKEKLVVIVSPKHQWAKRKSIKPELLFSEPMIGGEAGTGTGTLLHKIFGKLTTKIQSTMTLGSTEAVKTAVKAGLGVSLVFESAVEEEVKLGSLCALNVLGIDISKELFIVLPEHLPADSPSRRFAQLLLSRGA